VQDELDVTRQFITLLNRPDLGDLAAIVAPDAAFSFNGTPLSRNRLLERRAAAFQAGAPDARVIVEDVIGDLEGRVAVRYTVSGTHTGPLRLHFGELPPSGHAFSYSGAIFVTIEDGVITAADLVSDMESVLRVA
jgi:predicted ester cyclase